MRRTTNGAGAMAKRTVSIDGPEDTVDSSNHDVRGIGATIECETGIRWMRPIGPVSLQVTIPIHHTAHAEFDSRQDLSRDE